MGKLEPKYLFDSLAKKGIGAFFGVPDSLLKPFCAYVTDHTGAARHVIAANEGNAVALAAGHHLATGEIPCVYLENSGIGNAVNPILSMMHRDVYRMPCLLVIGWRGEPGTTDEPEHAAQGKLTEHCLTSIDVPYSILGESDGVEFSLDVVLDKAEFHFTNDGTPYAIVVEEGTLAPYELEGKEEMPELKLTCKQALEQVLRQLDSKDILVCTTGASSREVYEIRERAGQGHCGDFLVAGSMGHCSSIAAGIALARPERTVYCIDGDGAAIMHMGSLAVNGGLSAVTDLKSGSGLLRNLKHIVVNNGAHDSAGGQPTVGFDVSLTGVAKACGYCAVRDEPVMELGSLVEAMVALKQTQGPAFLEVLVERDRQQPDLGHSTPTPPPPLRIKSAFAEFVRGAGPSR